jgi:SAM-dependent methyltransferase
MMSDPGPAHYDTIGGGYGGYRMPDPRIAAILEAALEGACSVLNVGAGTGSYEPAGRDVTALEISRVMIDQRSPTAAPVVQGRAEALPFPDGAFDAAMGVLTLHHWRDQTAGLREAVRVARQQVVLLSWVRCGTRFWLFDYFPEIESIDHDIFPAVGWIEATTGCAVREIVVPIPADCSDGFLCSWWRRPEAYLDPGVRSAISTFPRLENVEPRLRLLRRDLESGDWRRRYGELLELEQMDYGYRVLVLQV